MENTTENPISTGEASQIEIVEKGITTTTRSNPAVHPGLDAKLGQKLPVGYT